MAENNVTEGSPVEPSGGQKKKLGTLAWVGIGCGALILIAFFIMLAGTWFAAKKIKDVAGDFEDNPAKSAAELIVKMNPDLELIENDEAEGTITVLQKSTGETASFDYSQIQEGKLGFEAGGEEFSVDVTGGDEGGVFTVKTEEGEARFGAAGSAEDLPSWVPVYPGASDSEASYTSTTSEAVSGIVSMQTEDDVDSVLEFYRSKLEESEYEANISTFSGADGDRAGNVVAQHQETDRLVNVSAGRQGEMTQITIQYSGKP
jgi:hypothetical protein